ncbi:hypothetical protein COU60_05370 [Candidatus Pacearchaeota archaeon CG10_big_fil_rev_8_21_14_0_10_34_76]|nr:MAG: hypothetical protein COU60_05370 [Candidatus Pacearchaeota archaeon CG10_big_fil_rev_8_21_14_0_10_34_76]
MADQEFKRHIAYKLRAGDILSGKIILDGERFKFLELDNKQVVRINLIANVVDKFIQDDEKKYGNLTLDDATGQIKIKAFGDDIEKLKEYIQGDTIQIIGLLRSWNNEVYITPEIIKKRVPQYLLLRKLEIEKNKPKMPEKSELNDLREKIIQDVKQNEEKGGIDIEKIILDLKQSPEIINSEIKRLLEEGIVYEPRPGKLRYLG